MRGTASYPSYLTLYHGGVLKRRAAEAWERLAGCRLCPRSCGVNRLAGETGICRTADKAWVSACHPHFGEEAPLTGKHGSGTIFFTHCNLLCIFCQNYYISHYGKGVPVSDEQLAEAMMLLQQRGCHNINLVTPTHVIPQVLQALIIAIEQGLRLPLVYNSAGYDLPVSLQLLDGVVDIYLPDFKFWNPEHALLACSAPDYPATAREAIKEMHRQVGDLVINDEGLAVRGLLLRHLVLPEGWAGTRPVMKFVAQELSPDTYVNIMGQYRPCYKAHRVKALAKDLAPAEYHNAVKDTMEQGIYRMDKLL